MSAVQADVAIIGGGLIGCMAAYYLRKRGKSVVLLERGRIGGESSGVSFGSLRLQGQHGAGVPIALRAHALWEGIESELGESVGFRQEGHLHLALTPEQVARLHGNADQLRPHGHEIELLDRAETVRRWPFLSGRVLAASWSSRDAVVNPRLVAPAFARAARRLGAVLHENATVISAKRGSGRFTLRGTGPTVVSDALVNAAGAWCGVLAALFNEDIPVFAAGPAEMVTEPVPAFSAPVIHVIDGSVLFRQTSRGNVVIGGHPRSMIDPSARAARVPPDKITTNLARLVAIVPRLRAHHVIRTWTGIEGYLPDMMPVVGPSATTPRLFYACAFSGHGLQMGPAAAMALTELIVNGGTQLPISPFAVERFRAGEAAAVRTMHEEFHGDVLAGKAAPWM